MQFLHYLLDPKDDVDDEDCIDFSQIPKESGLNTRLNFAFGHMLWDLSMLLNCLTKELYQKGKSAQRKKVKKDPRRWRCKNIVCLLYLVTHWSTWSRSQDLTLWLTQFLSTHRKLLLERTVHTLWIKFRRNVLENSKQVSSLNWFGDYLKDFQADEQDHRKWRNCLPASRFTICTNVLRDS